MEKPKHFGTLGVRAAVPWVRCPLCAAAMNLRKRKDGSEIYGCSFACKGARARESVDLFFETVALVDVQNAVAEVEANGGLAAHRVHSDGPNIKFVVRKSQIGLSRVQRKDQAAKLKEEKVTLAHIIPGQWNPDLGGLAVLVVGLEWAGNTFPDGAIVRIEKVINDGQFYIVTWPGEAEAEIAKVARDVLSPFRVGDFIWSLSKVKSIERHTSLFVWEITPEGVLVETDDEKKKATLAWEDCRLIRVFANGHAKVGSFFRAEGVARVLRVREVNVEKTPQVIGDNEAVYALADIELLSEGEVEDDVSFLVPNAEDDGGIGLDFDFGI